MLRKLAYGVLALVALVVGAYAAAVLVATWRPQRPVIEIPVAGALVLEHINVVDPRDGSIARNMIVEIEGGRILRVAPWTAEAAARPNTRRVDASGQFVTPGFNNMHSHVLQSRDPSGVLALMLAEGVTGFRQMAGADWMLAERREHRLPLTQYAPALLAMPGGLLTPFNSATPEDVRAEIAREAEGGADFIKIGLVPAESFWAALEAAREWGLPAVGHLQAGTGPARASREGMRSIEHLGPGNSVWIACSAEEDALFAEQAAAPAMRPLPFRLPYMEQVFMLWLEGYLAKRTVSTDAGDLRRLQRALDTFGETKCQQLAAAFVANQTWSVPTLVNLRSQSFADDPAILSDPMLRYMSRDSIEILRTRAAGHARLPSDMRAAYRRLYERQLNLVRLFADAGAPMMTGTDGGADVSATHVLGREFDELARAGLTPLQILQMTTINPAIFLGRTDTMGVVAPGFAANLVILEANPLDDTANLDRIAGVVRAGHYYSAADLEALRDRVAQAHGVLR